MSKIALTKRVSITMRGFSILKQYCPGLAQGKAAYELINSIQPFISVWFTAQIVNEISSQRRFNTILLFILGAVLLNFICSLLKNILNHVCNEKEAQMWNWFEKIFSDKQMSLDFVDLENAAIQHQRQEAQENLYMFGNGLAQLFWGISALVRTLVYIVLSLAMTISLFLSSSGNRFIDHPIWILIILVCIAIGGLSKSKATISENDIFTGQKSVRRKKKKKKTMTIEENGQTVTKEVTGTEANKLRLELARQREAELYKDERTTPLQK